MNAWNERALVVSALLALTAVPVRAQDPSAAATRQVGGITLDELMNVDVQRVFGASRFSQEVIEAPAVVSIVTSEEIDRFGYRTLADVLKSVRGFYVSNDRNYSYLGARGFSRPGDYNTRVLLLINGHRLNDNVYDQAPVGTEFPLDVELIDRVEIVQGPSSSLYGTSAFLAVVNVITKRPEDSGRLSGSVEAGSLGTRRVRGTASHVFSNGSAALFSVSEFHSDGQSRIFYPELQGTPTGGFANHLDYDRSWSVFGHASRNGWTAQALLAARTKGIPTGAFDTSLNDDRTRTRDGRAYLDLSYEGNWRGSTLSFRSAYDRYDYEGIYAAQMPQGLDPDPLFDEGHGTWWTTELSLSRRVARRHLFTAGGELRDNSRQDQSTMYPGSATVLLDDHRDSRVWGLYVQDEYHLAPRVLVNAGLRFDRMQDATTSTDPRVALILRPLDRAALKVLYGQAFRAANVYELFYGVPDSGRDLRPERIRSFEVVWEEYIARRFRVAGSTFVYRIRQLITQLDSESVFGVAFANVDAAAASGVSSEAEASLQHGVHLFGSYTYADAREPSTDARLSNSPEHVGHLRLTGPVAPIGTFVGVDATFLGHRQTITGSIADKVVLWNVTATNRHLVPHAAVALDIRNIFDRAYGDPGAAEHVESLIPQQGRTFSVRATWHF